MRIRECIGSMSVDEAKHSLQDIKIFTSSYKECIQYCKHNREFLKGLKAYSMFRNPSRS